MSIITIVPTTKGIENQILGMLKITFKTPMSEGSMNEYMNSIKQYTMIHKVYNTMCTIVIVLNLTNNSKVNTNRIVHPVICVNVVKSNVLELFPNKTEFDSKYE